MEGGVGCVWLAQVTVARWHNGQARVEEQRSLDSEQNRGLASKLEASEEALAKERSRADELATKLERKEAEVDSLTQALQQAILGQKGSIESQMQRSRKSR